MENCYVTKFIGVVDNDSLVKLNELRLNMSVDNNWNPAFRSVEAQTMTIVNGDATFTGGVKTITINQNWPTERIVADGTVGVALSIPDKYKVLSATGRVTDMASLSALKYSTVLDDFSLTTTFPITIDELLSLIPDTITSLSLGIASGELSKVIEKFGNTLKFMFYYNSNITGDFGDLGKFRMMTSYQSTPVGIQGDVVDFVANKRLIGITEGSVSFLWLFGDGRIKFNGNAIAGQQDNTISWTPTTITVNDVTINA